LVSHPRAPWSSRRFVRRNLSEAGRLGGGEFQDGNFRSDAVDLLEFGAAGAEDGGGIAEALQQLPDAHRTEAVNHIQSDKGFPVIHAGKETPFCPPGQALDFPKHALAHLIFPGGLSNMENRD